MTTSTAESYTGNYPRGEAVPQHVLTESQVLALRRDRANGARIRDLVKLYGVNKTTVQSICAGDTWAHVGGPRTIGRLRRDSGGGGPVLHVVGSTCPRCRGRLHREWDEVALQDDRVCMLCGWRGAQLRTVAESERGNGRMPEG